jgi:hypothetical protein
MYGYLMAQFMIVNQLCINRFRRAKLALVAALLIASSAISAQAATIPFTFEVAYDAFLGAVPSPTNLTVPGTNTGSGSFAPFGSAIYSETGTVTFAMLPSGDFVPSTVSLNFTASFNGGSRHIHRDRLSRVWRF